MGTRLLLLYFLIGGIIVALTTYFGSQGKGLLAAFISFLPSITIVTLCAIYFSEGVSATTSYIKGMLVLLPAWFLYALCLFYTLPRIGLLPSLFISVSLYLVASWATIQLVD
jgi:uncharacterized membrane protein (GlpM family)